MRLAGLLIAAACVAAAADKVPVSKLLLLSKTPEASEFRAALLDTLGEEKIKSGTAVSGHGPDQILAVESPVQPALFIDDVARPPMTRIAGTNLWFAADKVRTGASHIFHYVVEGKRFGGAEFPAYTPDSYEQPGVPKGSLSEKLMFKSRIYPGTSGDYWIYVPAQYRPDTPAALMVWQDGHNHVDRKGATRLQVTVDNLIHQKKIPVMILVLISPGTRGNTRMRSVQYDSVDDRYARFLRDEILPEIYKKYNVRKDGYSRAIAGNSSGGICAFNTAWQQPEEFSRVLSRIGSFTSIQWNRSEGMHGGHELPFLIRKEPKRNIRVWLQDGAEDLENRHGSWPLQNIQMANSLKYREYDFRLTWGVGAHSGHHGNSELPAELIWLWRGYDPGKTSETYEMDPKERDMPFFRVKTLNRETGR